MNAKDELLGEIKESGSTVKCALIDYGLSYYAEEQARFALPVGYNEERYAKFIDSLDFDYDNGYGGQFLYGIVWLEDGTWLSRGEYDGSEWWEHNVLPPIPTELLLYMIAVGSGSDD